jgi:hypothetical protein
VLVLDRADGALLEERGPFDPDRDEVPGWLLGGLEFSAVSDEDGAELRLRYETCGPAGCWTSCPPCRRWRSSAAT